MPDIVQFRGETLVEWYPDGDPIARPVTWEGEGKPVIYMHPERRGQPALAPGERVLAKLRHITAEKYEGRTLKRLGRSEDRRRILGVFQDGRIIPTDRRHKAEWTVPPGETGGAHGGEIVLAEALPSTGFGLRPARIVERLGRVGEPRSVSLICIHAHGIPELFTAEAEEQAESARAVPLGKRTDLRDPSGRSAFNGRRTMPDALRSLIAGVRAEVIVVSYNDESWIGRDELIDMCSERGEVRFLAFDSRRYVGATIGVHGPTGERVGEPGRLRNEEWVVVAGPKQIVERMTATPLSAHQ
jgi:hypothetical protein